MTLSPSAHVDSFTRDRLPPPELWSRLTTDLPGLSYPDRLNCAVELIDAMAREHGDRPCLRSPSVVWSYADVLRRANQVAQVLTDELDVVPGQRVMLRGPNTPWLVVSWLAALKAGAVVVTTMALLRRQEVEALVELTQSTLLLCDHRSLDDVPTLPSLVVVPFGSDRDDDLVTRSARRSGDYLNVETAADDVALLAATSGTTGKPKVTMHFHRDVLASADTFSRHVLQPRPSDVFTGTPPLAFTFGLGGLVVFPLRVGASTLLLERAAPAELAELVEQHGVTILFTAPTAYKAILKAGTAHQLQGLRYGVSAGEHLPEQTWNQLHEQIGLKIINGLGSTEMLHIFVSAAGDDIRPGSTGRAVPGFEVAVIDDEGRPVPAGTIGRLAVVGPLGCKYLADERQATYVRHGWNVTGDTFICDADGYFWYQGRTDDMIVSSGYNIGSPEVEWALDQHSDVLESAVVGQPDPERGMIVHAFVVLRPDVVADDALVAELQTFVKTTIAPYKYPRRIEFVSALPRTATGKIQRFQLRDRVV